MSAAASSDFVRAMGPVAREILGKPAWENKAELRYGTRGSLKITLTSGVWFDNESGKGGGVLDFVQDRRRLDRDGAILWLQERGHIPKPEPKPRIVAAYDYVDADGLLLFQVCRFEPKDFRQRRPNGADGWIWNMAGISKVLYRLPAIIAAVAKGNTIYVVEGEKGADAVESIGLVATCSPGGAGKWRAEYSAALVGADVVILPDHDTPGRKHAEQVATFLNGIAARVRVVLLPGLPEKGDAADWIASGGTAAALEEIAASVPRFDVPRDPKPKPPPAQTASLDGLDLTEDGIALAFTKEHQDHLRFDPRAGCDAFDLGSRPVLTGHTKRYA
jgi:putative DNA primase/helicase